LYYWPNRSLDQAYTFWYYRNPFPGCNTLFRKALLQKAYPIVNDNIRYHDTWVDTLACLCGNGISYIDQVTMLYRFHNNSVTSGLRRISRQNPARCLLSKFLFGTRSYVVDRKYYCQEISENDFPLSAEQKSFHCCAVKYHNHRGSFWGRTMNLLFDIRHFRNIYNL